VIPGLRAGGTFADFVLPDGAGRVRIHRMLTPARDQSLAIRQGIAGLEADPEATVVDGAIPRRPVSPTLKLSGFYPT
jgi:N-methylhydantoinase A/oxoprolinase/acetone carboxylase beta subunit